MVSLEITDPLYYNSNANFTHHKCSTRDYGY